MRTEILKLMADANGYVSGEQISGMLGISRAAVWKHIKALKEDGCVIEAHTNKGYRLISLPDLLKPAYIKLHMDDADTDVVWHKSVDSTNTQAKRLAGEGAACMTVVVAEHQTGGKGRLGRAWESSPGSAVQMSFLIRPDIRPAAAPVFNLAAAIGVCRAIKEECGIAAKIKWPNDVVLNGKKLCGILTEMSADMDRVEYLVCGMGINANQENFSQELADRATSLRMVTGKRINRAALCARLIENTAACFGEYLVQGLGGIIAEYEEKSAILGKGITVLYGNETFCGKCVGFGQNGELLMEADGKTTSFVAGEVSVRGMRDYV